MHSSSPSSSSSPSILLILPLLLTVVKTIHAQESVYVPGPVDDTPGANLVQIGAGVDGYTTYLIEGVTLQENSQSAIMTQYGTDGLPVVYNCALGPDAQASCSVVPANGAQYAYTEPITYFGQTTGQLPAAYNTPTTGIPDPLATGTSISSSPSSSSSPASGPTSIPTNTRGPQAGAQQQTAKNVFGAGADSTNHASRLVDNTSFKSIGLIAGCGMMAIAAAMLL